MILHLGRTGRLARLSVIAFAALILAGCASTQKINWDSRVGTYTWDEALAELGKPTSTTEMTGGVKSAEWITPRGMGNSTDSMPPVYTRDEVVTQDDTSGYSAPNKVLKLMFTPDGKLLSWQSNY